MNLDEAIQAHADWKKKFRVAIHKQETMDTSTIAKDDCCVLGKWLHAEAKSLYADIESYPVLVSHHKTFHAEAGKVASLVNTKKYAEAELALDAHTPYGVASQAVGQAIYRLRKEAGL
ncbi:chemotaxis protein [Candidatus Methylospira mobilis]|uniref:Chemotaxis protein n=1 Tax=Candidatus Methylospira mobilis TaxID=1808979 RepID=A0A5Q0BRU7_9GAMM|nr:chemotaxis protein [Candidatus Methylospira mobilis]